MCCVFFLVLVVQLKHVWRLNYVTFLTDHIPLACVTGPVSISVFLLDSCNNIDQIVSSLLSHLYSKIKVILTPLMITLTGYHRESQMSLFNFSENTLFERILSVWWHHPISHVWVVIICTVTWPIISRKEKCILRD